MTGRRKRQSSGAGTNIWLVIALTAFIFTLAVVIALNFKWLYYIDITLLGIEKNSGMNVASIRANYDALITYNQFWYHGELKFPTLIMSETGRIHFQEVKRIFAVIQYLCMISFVVSLVGIFRQRKRKQYGYLKGAGLLSLAIPVLLGLAALLDWNRFFTVFHTIFFRNNYWLFDSKTDPVILILPDTYFMHCAVLILLIVFLASMLCLKLYRKKKETFRSGKRGRKRSG